MPLRPIARVVENPVNLAALLAMLKVSKAGIGHLQVCSIEWGADILYPQCMLFPGLPGVATAVGLFALVWLVFYSTGKGQPVVFDPEGKHGEFGRGSFPLGKVFATWGYSRRYACHLRF